MCSGNQLTLTNILTGNANTVSWSGENGNGTITGGPYPTPYIYTPTITNGTVILTAITNDPRGDCGPGVDQVTITVNQVVTITSQPVSQIMCSGNTVIFSVTATGTGLTYQWQRDGVNVPGATSNTLTLNNITTSNAGNYTAVVSGTSPCSSVISSTAVLTVNQAVAISSQPVSQMLMFR